MQTTRAFRIRPGTFVTFATNGARIVRRDSEWKRRRDRQNAAREIARSLADLPGVKAANLEDSDSDGTTHTVQVTLDASPQTYGFGTLWYINDGANVLRRVRRAVTKLVESSGARVLRYEQPQNKGRGWAGFYVECIANVDIEV